MRSTPKRCQVGRLVALLGAILLLAACTDAGSDARSPAPTGSLTPPTSAGPSDSSGGGGYTRGDYSSAAPASVGPSSGAAGTVVNAASGSVGPYLTGANGRTLYTFKPDSANTSTCTGGCAANWPPFSVGTGSSLTAGDGVSGKLTSFARPDGTLQVAYNGAPLYYFASDAKAGDTNGQGAGGNWFVAAP